MWKDQNINYAKRANVLLQLLDGVLGLLDALLVFQEIPGEEWTEMAKLAFGWWTFFYNLILCFIFIFKYCMLINFD